MQQPTKLISKASALMRRLAGGTGLGFSRSQQLAASCETISKCNEKRETKGTIYRDILSYQAEHQIDFHDLVLYARDNKSEWFQFLCDDRNCAEVMVAILEEEIWKLEEAEAEESELHPLRQALGEQQRILEKFS